MKKGLLELDDPAGWDVGGVEGGASSGVPAGSHQTLVPSFDPSQYAEESEIRGRMLTLTDEVALEDARLQSLPTPLPFMPSALGSADVDALGPDEQVAILSARLAPLSRVPSLSQAMSELGALLEDSKTAYILGFVDGILPLETIIEVTGLPELDTLQGLDRMISQGVIVFRA